MKQIIKTIALAGSLLAFSNMAQAGQKEDFQACQDATLETVQDLCRAVVGNTKQSSVNRAIALGSQSWGHIETGDFDSAISTASASIALDASIAFVFNNRGFAYFKKRQFKEALDDYNQAIKLDSKHVTAHQNRALLFLEQEEFEKSLKDYTEVAKLDPKSATAWNDKGFLHFKLAQFDKALADYDRAIKQDPNLLLALANRAELLREMGQIDKALEFAKSLVKRFPESAAAYNVRGWILIASADFDGAIADASKAIQLDPTDANYLDTRGAAHLKKGDFLQAVEDFNRAIELNKFESSYYSQRAKAKFGLSDSAGAKQDAEEALALKASDKLAKQVLTDLEILSRKQVESDTPLIESPVVAIANGELSSKAKTDAPLGRRVALVMGNSAYGDGMALPNPVNDANAVSTALKRLGFDVILSANATKASMDEAMYQFAVKAEGADAALVFYAGHGMQVDGVNYLMPVDGSVESKADLKHKFVAANDILDDLRTVKGMRMMILDACRNNPLSRSIKLKLSKVANRAIEDRAGLADMKAEGVLIAFATQPNEVAADGDGVSSPFTLALLKHIETPNIEIDTMFKRVRTTVSEMTDGGQLPQTVNSSTGEFYLKQE